MFNASFKDAAGLSPSEPGQPPRRVRGGLSFSPRRCSGCALCVMDCPSRALELVTLERAARRYVLKFSMDRCIFCGQCVASCEARCIDLLPEERDPAVFHKEELIVYYGEREDIERHLAAAAP